MKSMKQRIRLLKYPDDGRTEVEAHIAETADGAGLDELMVAALCGQALKQIHGQDASFCLVGITAILIPDAGRRTTSGKNRCDYRRMGYPLA